MKEIFSKLFKEAIISIKRFYIPFYFSILLFLRCGYMVIFESNVIDMTPFQVAALTCLFEILFSIFVKIFVEKYGEKLKILKIVIDIGLFLLAFPIFFLLNFYHDNIFFNTGFVGILISLFVSIIYFADTQSIFKTFSHLFKRIVFNGFVCGIISAGTTLSILAFTQLIYDFKDSYKSYFINLFFIWIVIFFNMTFSAIPRKDTEFKNSNLFKVIVLYVALPVYLLLITILYAYLGKILITFSFPSGQINWFASFASLLFIFFILTLEPYKNENKFAKIFVSFGGFVLIPIIIVQFISIYIRYFHYGLTSLRYVSIVLNLIALIFTIISLIKNGKYVKQMLVVLIAATLLLTVTPLNIHDVPIYEQTARLVNILKKNNMIESGKITDKFVSIAKEEKIKITRVYDYLYSTYDKRSKFPDILDSTGKKSFENIFGFSKEYEANGYYSYYGNENRQIYGAYQYQYKYVDIREYNKFYTFDVYGNDKEGSLTRISMQNSEKVVLYDMETYIRELYTVHGTTLYDIKMEIQVGKDLNDLLVLTFVDFSFDDSDKFTLYSARGYFFEK